MKINPFLNAVEALKSSSVPKGSSGFGEELKSIMGAMESISTDRSSSVPSNAIVNEAHVPSSDEVSCEVPGHLEEATPLLSDSNEEKIQSSVTDPLDAQLQEVALEEQPSDEPVFENSLDLQLQAALQLVDSQESTEIEPSALKSAIPQELENQDGSVTALNLQVVDQLFSAMSTLQPSEPTRVQLGQFSSVKTGHGFAQRPTASFIKEPLKLPDGVQPQMQTESVHLDPMELIDASRSFSGTLQGVKELSKSLASTDLKDSLAPEVELTSLGKTDISSIEASSPVEGPRAEQVKLIEKIDSVLKQLESKAGLSGTTKFVLPNGSELNLKSENGGQSISISIVLGSKSTDISGSEVFAHVARVAESAGITLNSMDFNGQRFDGREQTGSQAWQHKQNQGGSEKRPSTDISEEGPKEMNASAPALNPKGAVSHFA